MTSSLARQPMAALQERLRRPFLGVRTDALLEIGIVLALSVAIDMMWGHNDRFIDIWPHPFWLVVLLAASYYGTREGIAAAILSSAVLLLAQVPEGGASFSLQSLPARAALQPLAWGVAALIFGEIRDAWRRRSEKIGEELVEVREHMQEITRAYGKLQSEKEHLESRVAGQLLTVNSMYGAARAIQKQGVGDVLIGVGELVRNVLAPEKFSLFLLNGAHLEATICEGWAPEDLYAREFDETSPLYHAVVFDRRHLVVSQPSDEPILHGEGILAGPVIDGETGGILGMLKIERIRFLDLNPASVQNFRILCEWIGSALVNAQQVERMRPSGDQLDNGPVRAPQQYLADREMLASLAACVKPPGRVLHLAFEGAAADGSVDLARCASMLSIVAQRELAPHQRCYESGDADWPFAVLLPGATAEAAKTLAERLTQELAAAMSPDTQAPTMKHRVTPLRAAS